MDSVIEMSSNYFSTTRISWHKDVLADIAVFEMNMVL
jgi:hypothetical protein